MINYPYWFQLLLFFGYWYLVLCVLSTWVKEGLGLEDVL